MRAAVSDALLLGDGLGDIREALDGHQTEQLVFRYEFRAEAVAVQIDACGKVIGDAGVEGPAFPVGEDVDVEHRRSVVSSS